LLGHESGSRGLGGGGNCEGHEIWGLNDDWKRGRKQMDLPC
jgi:hypothetical protein